jgi:hypothetical protein
MYKMVSVWFIAIKKIIFKLVVDPYLSFGSYHNVLINRVQTMVEMRLGVFKMVCVPLCVCTVKTVIGVRDHSSRN